MTFSFKSHAQTGDHHCAGHNDTADGNPAGGWATGPGAIGFPMNGLIPETPPGGRDPLQPAFAIRWQDGPADREAGEKPNGAVVEDLIDICKRRLEFYQDSPFACHENEVAIGKLEDALETLLSRRKDRVERGVQGKHEA